MFASVHAIGNDQLLIKSVRCLGLLLIPMKSKEATGDIPFLMRFMPVSVYMLCARYQCE